VQLAAGGDVQQALGADVLRAVLGQLPAALQLRVRVGQGVERAVGLLPGELLGGRDDRPERHPDPGTVGAAGERGLLVDGGDLLARLGERLAPQAEDVAERPADPVGLGR
jgi:hypothetical protein